MILMMAGIAGFTMVSNTYAQTTTTTTSSNTNPGGVYIRGGLSLANISTNGDGTTSSSNTLATFNAGFLGDLPLNDMFSLQAGLFLQGKGAKANQYLDDNNHNDNYVKASFRPYYLQVPVNFAVKVPLGTDSRIFIAAGPFVSMGLWGNTTVRTKVAGGAESVTKSDIKFESVDGNGQNDNNYDRFKRFEFGLNGAAGIEAGRMMLGVNYDWGLSKINQIYDNQNNDKNKYRTFSINLGYRLN
ncbi:hypothetical protein FLA_6156 [Filimonas lacunae]|nr:hypothetical protein FLA_6156 [Filimonas lacunae]